MSSEAPAGSVPANGRVLAGGLQAATTNAKHPNPRVEKRMLETCYSGARRLVDRAAILALPPIPDEPIISDSANYRILDSGGSDPSQAARPRTGPPM
jgi:hypothetical protein